MRSKFIFGHFSVIQIGGGGRGPSQWPACMPFGDIHSICPWANAPILVYAVFILYLILKQVRTRTSCNQIHCIRLYWTWTMELTSFISISLHIDCIQMISCHHNGLWTTTNLLVQGISSGKMSRPGWKYQLILPWLDQAMCICTVHSYS